MLFSKKKQEGDTNIVEEQKVATLEVKTEPQINQDILTRLQFLEEQNAKNGKDINKCKQEIHTIEDWVHLYNGGKTKQNTVETNVKKNSNSSDMRNKTAEAIRKKTECKLKRAAYREILQAIAGKGNPLKTEIHQVIEDILVKHQIGRTSYRGYVLYLKTQKKMKDDGQKRYKMLI